MLPTPRELDLLWKSRLHRKPLQGHYHLITNDGVELSQACQNLCNDPKLPEIIGVDVEFYKGNLPCSDWHPHLNSFPIDKFGIPGKHGPFARCIQLARGDGLTYIFDLFTLQHFPVGLIQLLSDPTMLQ